MPARTRLERLERILPPPRPPTREDVRRGRRWKEIERRLLLLVREAERLLTEAENERWSALEKDDNDDGSAPFDGWLRDLQLGRSRLPELTPSVMKAVIMSWFHPDLDSFSSVCNRCGLQ